ncbi:MAG: glycosyltransferase [Deltaproteobacteria bacterium]|nr:glycosyltransferase [Deltaproteobacteria bacterium]
MEIDKIRTDVPKRHGLAGYAPFVSIVVRSFQRPEALLELVERLRLQNYPSFEIVVVEQSNNPGLEARLASLRDSRLKVIACSPLGAPAARNEGIRHTCGDILVFIDDDDLPIDDEWLTNHVANYSNPLCMGVVGRLTDNPGQIQRPRFPRLVHRLAFRYTFFKDPMTYAWGSLRKEGIDFLIGSNASVRRSLIERIGGWDEGIPVGEEQSFSFKFARNRKPGEQFIYDPKPIIWRRVNIEGGLNRRSKPDWYIRELNARISYYHDVVAYYFPWRVRLLYPIFLLRTLEQVWEWIWDPDNNNRDAMERFKACAAVVLHLPVSLHRRWRQGSSNRVSRIDHLI